MSHPCSHQKLLAQATVLTRTEQPVIRINAGSSKNYTDPDGNLWVTDKGFYNTGSTYSTYKRIANTDKPVIYQTERYKPMTYNISLPDGIHDIDVYLHWAEIYNGAFRVGARVFNVFMEGELVADNLDCFVAAGYEGNRAYIMKKTNVIVSDGALTIDFARVRQMPKINAIEIHSAATASLDSGTTTSSMPDDAGAITSTTDAGTATTTSELTTTKRTEDLITTIATMLDDQGTNKMTCGANLLSTVPAECDACANCCPEVLQCDYFIFIGTYLSYDDCFADICSESCLQVCPQPPVAPASA